MDHAEAHERLADLALVPRALDRLLRLDAAGPDERALLDHVAGCPTCAADLAALRAVDHGLRDGLAEVREASAVEPIHPPDWLRGAVLEAARREPHPARAPLAASREPSRGTRWWPALPRLAAPQWAAGLAAVLAVALLGGLAGRTLWPAGGSGPDASMVAAVATLDRVLAAPDHRVVSLRDSSGAPAGSVAWSSQEFVVLTSALSAPSSDRVYRCWLQWAGRWTAVGSMDFAGATAYWTGPVGQWGQLLADPGTRFVVTAELAGSTTDAPAGGVLLQAGLGS